MVTGAPLRREEPLQAGDSRPRWIMTNKVPWRDADGRVIGVVGVCSDITDRKNMEHELRRVNNQLQARYDELRDLHAQLREQSLRDPVTQLYNRRYLNEVLPREVDRALQHKRSLGILMIDVDHFKLLNDTCGHSAGDDTLQSLARQVQMHLRPGDIACRYGGDEILCLLPDTSGEEAALLAEQVRAAICRQPLILTASNACITVSIGVAVVPAHGADPISALNAVDDALYCAKASGRNRVCLAPGGAGAAQIFARRPSASTSTST
jgi:diguanylate cyclase (GGDEF)-like protein